MSILSNKGLVSSLAKKLPCGAHDPHPPGNWQTLNSSTSHLTCILLPSPLRTRALIRHPRSFCPHQQLRGHARLCRLIHAAGVQAAANDPLPMRVETRDRTQGFAQLATYSRHVFRGFQSPHNEPIVSAGLPLGSPLGSRLYSYVFPKLYKTTAYLARSYSSSSQSQADSTVDKILTRRVRPDKPLPYAVHGWRLRVLREGPPWTCKRKTGPNLSLEAIKSYLSYRLWKSVSSSQPADPVDTRPAQILSPGKHLPTA